MSGLDMTSGTSDDYTINLVYDGITSGGSCNINIKHHAAYTGLAVCSLGGQFVNSNHITITTADIQVGAGFNWFYNNIESDLIFKNGFQ
jgi:hypothetical protein